MQYDCVFGNWIFLKVKIIFIIVNCDLKYNCLWLLFYIIYFREWIFIFNYEVNFFIGMYF